MTKPRPTPPPARRLSNWPALFGAFIESRRSAPFAWGQHDCCLFACDGILAHSGLDPAAKLFRGKYRDALGAARLVRKHGGIEAIATKVCSAHGWPALGSPLLAQRGDVVLLLLPEDPMGAALGLCLGAEVAFTGPAGITLHPLTACAKAWAVARPTGGTA